MKFRADRFKEVLRSLFIPFALVLFLTAILEKFILWLFDSEDKKTFSEKIVEAVLVAPHLEDNNNADL